MRCAVAIILLCASPGVAGCSSSEGAADSGLVQANLSTQQATERLADAKAVGTGFRPAPPAPLETASVDPVTASAPGAILPPTTMQYRYIGRWAATSALCEGGAWTFSTRKLATTGKIDCDLPVVATVPSGYEMQGICKTGGTKTVQTLKLVFDEPAKRLHVSGQTVGPATLLYCGN